MGRLAEQWGRVEWERDAEMAMYSAAKPRLNPQHTEMEWGCFDNHSDL